MTGTPARDVFVEGIAFWAPALQSWKVARAVLAGGIPPATGAPRRPSPELLPPAERRRATDSVALAIEVAASACAAAGLGSATLPSVFATTHGDLPITHSLCETLAGAPLHTSPTKFHNSVHNAAAGYWCIASRCHAPYTTVSVHGYSFAAGLLEAFIQVQSGGEPILYVAYDVESCGPLVAVAASRGLLGAGLVLSADRSPRSVARLSWSVRPGELREVTRADPRNAALVAGNAMAPCLALFEALARGAGPLTLALGTRVLLDIIVADAAMAAP